ncbi:type II toxin-antitoxin system VapC family toxin [Acidianus ambivalens]|nr:PIN domain-containing protein [Acidianus ambivalens]
MVVIRNKYMEMMKKGYKDRVEGYLNFIKLIKNEMKNSIIDVNKDDILKAIDIIFEREINVGDAINVATARKMNVTIVSNDKDYDRVKDLVEVIRP